MPPLSWFGIFRLALVQTAIGAIFVLSTSTLNRVMVVELALPAAVPGALISLHYAMQVLRPRLGYGSDTDGRRTPWIIAGMAVLATGGVLAAAATNLMAVHPRLGIALAAVAFVLIGLGVGAAGTTLLVLLAKRTAPSRRPAAATIAWVMMIAGFIVTAGVAGKMLDPFSPQRLLLVASTISGIGFLASCCAVWGLEGTPDAITRPRAATTPFSRALRDVWAEPEARRFAIFIFMSMLAYGGEELLIEPFAGATFAMTPGETARLSGVLHGGSLCGMIVVGVVANGTWRSRSGALRLWMIGGCLASATALISLAALGLVNAPALLPAGLFVLGASNGAYAIAAIGAMMQLVGAGGADREGIRMGLWGAAQAVAFGSGSLVATTLSDIARHVLTSGPLAYGTVFACEAAIFVVSAGLARRLDHGLRRPVALPGRAVLGRG